MTLWKLRVRRAGPCGSAGDAPGGGAGQRLLAFHTYVDSEGVVQEVLLDAPPRRPAAEVAATFCADSSAEVLVRPGDVHDLLDPEARCLELVGELQRQPHLLLDLVAGMLDADVRPVGDTEEANSGRDRMQVLRANRPIGTLVRHAFPFTCTEAAKVEAMARVSHPGLDSSRPASGARLRLRDRHEVVVRTAGPRDRGFLRALRDAHDARDQGGAGIRADAIDLTRRAIVTLVAVDLRGDRVAAARLVSTGSRRSGNVALFVQDQWQPRGLGAALLLRVAEVARSRGMVELRSMVHVADSATARSFLEAGATLGRAAGALQRVTLATDLSRVRVPCPACHPSTGEGRAS